MARIKIKDLPVDHTVSRQDMKMVFGGTQAGDDMQMWQFNVQQETQNLTRYLTMMSNISSAWDKAMNNIVQNIK